MEDDGYMPLAQVARFLNVTRGTIQRWIREYNIAHLRVPGGRTGRETYLVSIPALKQFIADRTYVKPDMTASKKKPGRPPKLIAL